MESKFVMAGDIRTHYLEAGEGGETLILLHGGEYGGCAENSFEYNIDALAEHFHVYAVYMVGFGLTDKVFHFGNMRSFRIRHIRRFMETLCIESASFIGNSTGGGLPLEVASMPNPVWNIKKIITISGGGPNNPEAHRMMNGYDGTKAYMKRIHELMFVHDRWKTDDYVEKRYRSSIVPGAWECLSAARFRAPGAAAETPASHPGYSPAFRNIRVPVLIVAGDRDALKPPDYAEKLAELIPNREVARFSDCGHCAQIEFADDFNRLAADFLLNE